MAARKPVGLDSSDMFSLYFEKLPFEEKDYDVDESSFYHPFERRLPNTIQVVKKLLKQVRETGGYDIDVVPPSALCSPFLPIPIEEVRDKKGCELSYANTVKAVECAIQKINADTFLTFTAKDENDANGYVYTFQARVYAPFEKDHIVEDWRFKPYPAAATTANSTSDVA